MKEIICTAAFCILFASPTAAQSSGKQPDISICRGDPVVEPCREVRGRLNAWGAPYGEISMWIVGTKRMPRVMHMPDELWAMFKKEKENTRMIFGNFEMCPLTKDIPGNRQDVCITKASKLSQYTKEQDDAYWEQWQRKAFGIKSSP